MRAKTNISIALVLAVAGVLVSSQLADARVRGRRQVRRVERENYTQAGFQLYAGFGAQGYEIVDDDYEQLDDQGSEGMLFLGAAVGVSDQVAIFLEGAGSEHETDMGDVTFGYTHIGLKFAPNAGRGRSWQPYGKISVGAMFLFEEDHSHIGWYHHDDDGYAGPSATLAIGIDKFLNRHAAIYGEVGMMMGRFDSRIVDGHDHELADKFGATSAKLQLGIRFRL
jgi:hypothetical protein